MCIRDRVLRRMTTDDCEMMFGNWANDPEVTRYLRWESNLPWSSASSTTRTGGDVYKRQVYQKSRKYRLFLQTQYYNGRKFF